MEELSRTQQSLQPQELTVEEAEKLEQTIADGGAKPLLPPISMPTYKQNPHQGEITINAIVYRQMPDGNFHPGAVWHDAFAIRLLSDTPEACIEEIKELIEKIKELSKKDG
jgi:hypothetical protein